MSKENRLWTFIMDYFGQKWWSEVKNVLIMDLLFTNLQLLASQDVNWWNGVVCITCGLLWCFYQLSFWRHPFTDEDPLVSKWGSIGEQVMQCYISPNLFWWPNKLIYLRVNTLSANLNFWVNCSFKKSVIKLLFCVRANDLMEQNRFPN